MTKLKRGPLKGKTISYASTDRIEELRRVADDFMLEIFDLLPGEYLITDESSLRDFTDFGISETSTIWSNITKFYAIGHADIPSERLADIFDRNGRLSAPFNGDVRCHTKEVHSGSIVFE